MALDILAEAARRQAQGEAFCLATVVRTVAATAAKAGAKALIDPDGTIRAGWIGGGCARGAVLAAARAALGDGAPRLVSIVPEADLTALGVGVGETASGVRYARNLCPSQGTMDVFVEPMLPRPALLVLGQSPVAAALRALAPGFGYAVSAEPSGDAPVWGVVVATQGSGDEAGLRTALDLGAAYVGFVGSTAKGQALRARLAAQGADAATLDAVVCPAGLDLGAITPDEIALSILAQMLARRRQGQRSPERS